MNRLNTTESTVFLDRRFSLFLKDPFFQIICMLTGKRFKCLKSDVTQMRHVPLSGGLAHY